MTELIVVTKLISATGYTLRSIMTLFTIQDDVVHNHRVRSTRECPYGLTFILKPDAPTWSPEKYKQLNEQFNSVPDGQYVTLQTNNAEVPDDFTLVHYLNGITQSDLDETSAEMIEKNCPSISVISARSNLNYRTRHKLRWLYKTNAPPGGFDVISNQPNTPVETQVKPHIKALKKQRPKRGLHGATPPEGHKRQRTHQTTSHLTERIPKRPQAENPALNTQGVKRQRTDATADSRSNLELSHQSDLQKRGEDAARRLFEGVPRGNARRVLLQQLFQSLSEEDKSLYRDVVTDRYELLLPYMLPSYSPYLFATGVAEPRRG